MPTGECSISTCCPTAPGSPIASSKTRTQRQDRSSGILSDERAKEFEPPTPTLERCDPPCGGRSVKETPCPASMPCLRATRKPWMLMASIGTTVYCKHHDHCRHARPPHRP